MIYIKQNFIKQIIEHAKKEFPNEVCGILAGLSAGRVGQTGKERKVVKIYQMINIDKSSKTFFMDPKQQLKVMKEMRNLGMEMIGIYHSHSQTEAYPSVHDVELAYYPEASYVIVSIKDKANPRIRSFKIIEEKITEEQVRVERDL